MYYKYLFINSEARFVSECILRKIKYPKRIHEMIGQ